MASNIIEDKCKGCSYLTTWNGPYGNVCYPACSHPDSGPRTVNLLDEITKCPKQN